MRQFVQDFFGSFRFLWKLVVYGLPAFFWGAFSYGLIRIALDNSYRREWEFSVVVGAVALALGGLVWGLYNQERRTFTGTFLFHLTWWLLLTLIPMLLLSSLELGLAHK